MKKYIIFDFDGTLANTNDVIVASWQATLEHYLGHSLPVREIEATFGETLMHTIAEKLPGEDPDEGTFRAALVIATNEEQITVHVDEAGTCWVWSEESGWRRGK